MTSAFLTLQDRLYAIMCDARGGNGALGADALAKHIPATRFRRALDGAPLRDPTYPPDAFDRAVYIDWLSDADDGEIHNPLDGPHFCVARISIANGVVVGTALAPFVATVGTESAATSVLHASARALNDALRISRALACPDLLRGGTALDPVPLACVRDGGTTIEDMGDGRRLAVTTYSLRYMADNATNYDP
jgi:hypothetical protein